MCRKKVDRKSRCRRAASSWGLLLDLSDSSGRRIPCLLAELGSRTTAQISIDERHRGGQDSEDTECEDGGHHQSEAPAHPKFQHLAYHLQ